MQIQIGQRLVGDGQPCFIIAEAGVGHGGNLARAKDLAVVAKQAGADAAKFQTFHAEQLVTRDAPAAPYQQKAGWVTQYDALKSLEFTPEQWCELARFCREIDITFLSTPFDPDSADLLEDLGIPAFKIASGELINLELIDHVAKKGKPMIVSTGMGTLGEVERAVRVVETSQPSYEEGVETCDNHEGVETPRLRLVLLQCCSSYPARPEDVNLRAMQTLSQAFGCLVGYSDHTTGLSAPLGAVALGACLLEKHIRQLWQSGGPDDNTAIDNFKFAEMVKMIRELEAALGDGVKRPVASEIEMARYARRRVVETSENNQMLRTG